MSDFMAYDPAAEKMIDLRGCSDGELLEWLGSSEAVGDDVVAADTRQLLIERNVSFPGRWDAE